MAAAAAGPAELRRDACLEEFQALRECFARAVRLCPGPRLTPDASAGGGRRPRPVLTAALCRQRRHRNDLGAGPAWRRSGGIKPSKPPVCPQTTELPRSRSCPPAPGPRRRCSPGWVRVTHLFLFIKKRIQIRMLQLILLMGSPSQRSTRPGEPLPAGQGSFQPSSGAHAIPRSRNARSIFGPFCSHRERQTGGAEPAARGMKEPARLPLTSARLVGATARIHLPRIRQGWSRAPEPVPASRSGSGAPGRGACA